MKRWRIWIHPVVIAFITLSVCNGLTVRALADDIQEIVDKAALAEQNRNFSVAAVKYAEAAKLFPDNTDILIRLAYVRGYLGEYEEALDATEKGLKIEPQNIELKFARSRILAWAGRYDEAGRLADEIIAENPLSSEAFALKGRIEYYQGRLGPARSEFVKALAIDPNNADAKAGYDDVARAMAVSPANTDGEAGGNIRRWRVDTGYLHSDFSRVPTEDWRESYFRIEHTLPTGTSLSFRVDNSRRFDDTETAIGGGVAQQINPALRGFLEGATAPDAVFLPRWTVATGGNIRLFKSEGFFSATYLIGAFRHKHYATVDIQDVGLGFEQYIFDGRLWITGKWISVFDRKADSRTNGWYGRLDWQAAARLRLYAGSSNAPETEGGITTDTQSYFGGLAIGLSPNVDLNVDLAREDREDSYIRTVYGMGLTLKF